MLCNERFIKILLFDFPECSFRTRVTTNWETKNNGNMMQEGPALSVLRLDSKSLWKQKKEQGLFCWLSSVTFLWLYCVFTEVCLPEGNVIQQGQQSQGLVCLFPSQTELQLLRRPHCQGTQGSPLATCEGNTNQLRHFKHYVHKMYKESPVYLKRRRAIPPSHGNQNWW